jgi:hypothetical protein
MSHMSRLPKEPKKLRSLRVVGGDMTSIYIRGHREISREHYSQSLPTPTTQDLCWNVPSFVHQQMRAPTDWCLDTMAVMEPQLVHFYKLCFIGPSITS